MISSRSALGRRVLILWVPWKACRQCMEEFRERGKLTRIRRLQVVLYGSLTKTGLGHGAHWALILGLRGEDPVTMDVEGIAQTIDAVRKTHHLQLLGAHEVQFDPAIDIVYRRDQKRPFHPNALDIRVLMGDEDWQEETYYSVGGGFVIKEGEEDREAPDRLPYPISSGGELRTYCYCAETGCSISELVRRNERFWQGEEEIDAGWSRSGIL